MCITHTCTHNHQKRLQSSQVQLSLTKNRPTLWRNLSQNSPLDIHAQTHMRMHTHLDSHTNLLCKHTLTLPPEERMFVRKECLSLLLQKTVVPNMLVCFPCSTVHSNPDRAQLFFFQPLCLPVILSKLTKQSVV